MTSENYEIRRLNIKSVLTRRFPQRRRRSFLNSLLARFRDAPRFAKGTQNALPGDSVCRPYLCRGGVDTRLALFFLT